MRSSLASTVGRALAFAHANGLVHRDVKPQNVLIDRDGRPKVTDFGIARSLDVDGMTRTGTVLGTSNYIAPEQAGGRPVDALTDVYSLGCVLYELLTGEVPFEGENFVAVALKHVNEPPPRVIDRRPEVPLRVSNAVERAMAKDPRDRFPVDGRIRRRARRRPPPLSGRTPTRTPRTSSPRCRCPRRPGGSARRIAPAGRRGGAAGCSRPAPRPRPARRRGGGRVRPARLGRRRGAPQARPPASPCG